MCQFSNGYALNSAYENRRISMMSHRVSPQTHHVKNKHPPMTEACASAWAKHDSEA